MVDVDKDGVNFRSARSTSKPLCEAADGFPRHAIH
jgi:hypothetical protein